MDRIVSTFQQLIYTLACMRLGMHKLRIFVYLVSLIFLKYKQLLFFFIMIANVKGLNILIRS
jgi:hypothetical protein